VSRRNAKEPAERLEEVGMLDRLGQQGIDVVPVSPHAIVGLPDRRQHHDGHLGEPSFTSHAAREHESVDLGHLVVGDHHVEARPRARSRLQRRHGRFGITHRRRRHVPAREHLLEDAAVRRVVVDDEHTQSFERARFRERRGRDGGLGLVERCREEERAASTLRALDPDPSAHQLDEAEHDRETQSCAAIASGRRAVGLRERPKDVR
jgi:hypothetical protein